MRAGVYTRLSRLKATDELTRLALERQDEDAMALATARGYEIVKTYADPGISAADEVVREQFEQALADLAERVIDVLVIPKFDRMTRGLATWLRIERVLLESGGILVSAVDGDLDPSTPNGKFILRQRAQMAEYELDMIRERVKRWHRQRAHAGKPLVSGRRPFGYATKDRSEVDEVEAEVIRGAAELLLPRPGAPGGKSLNYVTAWANDQGAVAPNGKPWRPPNFRQMLMSPGIAGLRYYHGAEVAKGDWEPILDKATWQKLRAKFEANRQPGRPGVHLLSGLVRCGRCGQPMHTKYSRAGRQWACRTRPGQRQCGRVTILAEPVELLVSERILDRLQGDGLTRALAVLGNGKVDAAAQELADAETARDEIEAWHKTGAIKGDAFLRMHGPAEERVVKARRVLKAQTGRSVLADLPGDADDLRSWWYDPDTTVAERRSVVEACLAEIVIEPSGPRMSKFDPARVVIPKGAWKV
jgi:site-specific DNA recombinase